MQQSDLKRVLAPFLTVFLALGGMAPAYSNPALGFPGDPSAAPSAPNVDMSKVRRNVRAEEERERNVVLSTLVQGDPKRKEIALTFDDGPHPVWTPRLLDLLQSLNVHATFFVVGKMVDKYPGLVIREVAEGHEIANHTYSHPNLTKLTPTQVQAELEKGADAVKRAVGFSPVFFRPPGGQYNTEVMQAAREINVVPVLWTANSKDFLHPSPELVERRLLSAPPSGGILLCHDGIEETMQVLPDIVNRLRAKGYRFVTVSELAKHTKSEANRGQPANGSGEAAPPSVVRARKVGTSFLMP